LELLFCLSIVYRSGSHSRAKKYLRSEQYFNHESSRLHEAHLIDLFGSLRIKKPTKSQRGNTARVHFSQAMGKAMFLGLDIDCDDLITRENVEQWVKAQNFNFDLSTFEIEAFLRGGRFWKDDVVREIDSPQTVLEMGKGEPNVNVLSHAEQTLTTANENSLEPPSSINEESLRKCLKRFPMLAFNWDDPLGVLAEGSAFRARAQGRAVVSRELSLKIFKRIDSDNDGWVHPSDVRTWRRMLPIGRPADALVRSLFAGAQKVHKKIKSTPPKLQRTQNKDQMDFAVNLTDRIKQRSFTTLKDDVSRIVFSNHLEPEDVGLNSWDLFLILRDNPMLGGELAAQYALLDYLVAGDLIEDSESERQLVENIRTRRRFHHLTYEIMTNVSGNVSDTDQGLSHLDPRDKSSNVPNEEAVAAFVCVAKLKLCRMSQAQVEIDTREEQVAGNEYQLHRSCTVRI
jgi:hypothetical protein